MKRIISFIFLIMFCVNAWSDGVSCDKKFQEVSDKVGISLEDNEKNIGSYSEDMIYDPFPQLENRGLKRYRNRDPLMLKDTIKSVSALDGKIYVIWYQFNEEHFRSQKEVINFVSERFGVPKFGWIPNADWGPEAADLECKDFSVTASTGVDTDGKVYPGYVTFTSKRLDDIYKKRSAADK